MTVIRTTVRAGVAVGDYLRTPGLSLRLVNPPGDFNADEAVRGWVREEATGNLCRGPRPWRIRNFFYRLACRKEGVKRRCRTVLQSRAEPLPGYPGPIHAAP